MSWTVVPAYRARWSVRIEPLLPHSQEDLMAQCDSCRKTTTTKLTTTVTGRRVCSACSQGMLGAAAGILSVSPAASTESETASAEATKSFFTRLRRGRSR